MKKMVFIAGALMLVVAGSAMAAGTNLTWNDCAAGGGAADRTVACTNTGSGTMYLTFVTDTDIQSMAASDAFIDVVPVNPIGASSWWNTTPFGTRWGSSSADPASGACPAWWAAAASGPIVFAPTGTNMTSRLRVRLSAVIAAGEEQVVPAATETYAGGLILKNNAGTFGNAECTAGAAIGVANLVVQQPGQTDIAFQQAADVSNCVTFRNPPSKQCPGATPTEKSTWGSIKALYR